MGRNIINAHPNAVATRSGTSTGNVNSGDDYGDKLLKLIPGEVIALYMTMDGVIADNGDNSGAIPYIVLLIGLLATWFYMHVYQKVEDKKQILVSVMAFAIWAINIGHGFADSEWIKPSYAALALTLFTFFVPKIPMGINATDLSSER